MSKVIIKRGLLSAGILLFLLAVILIPISSGFFAKTAGRDQQVSSKFYALHVVYEKNVQRAEDSLGEPDGCSAEIQPGGQLEVLMEKTLTPSLIAGYGENLVCLDSGSVVGRGETEFGLEGRFSWRDVQGNEHHDWILLSVTATGFCVPPPPLEAYPSESSTGVDIVKITNAGTKSLFVDTVIGYTWQF
jgi:hypothetical protein